ncbi:hypothetical protein ASPACDRAFT_1879878 [Aspergillus aculeatus ATCC 16872]|uniref:Uncharacterized protein n=1 Tax=Aspergillus aculeatus (strain ATCC 16872 / CBS 172.66 / WB 5094) TaxID=690307 RepID=A0A1L9WYP9_ASPA1|nr:uncharacterized protein ASPACDRAFT_1879878 [Aspergillus aculeatus ATCC 16872]OJK01294.1 hypothetical protein ASPACDRAFT_1879878 [Aspergillus aculeatus ATCC 16872]
MSSAKHSFRVQNNITYKQLPIDSVRVGPPRLNAYKRLLGRFYEPLFLLRVLGQTRGQHTVGSSDPSLEQETRRRRFLRNLAFVCDFTKGGISCTAIGLEDSETCYRFWISSNASVDKIVEFAKNALSRLKRFTTITGDIDGGQYKAEFTGFCLDFAISRVKKERQCLFQAINQCYRKPGSVRTEQDQMIKDWLEPILEQNDCLALCHYAYVHRKSAIRIIGPKAQDEEKLMGLQDRRSPFALVIHYIGRLADHIRAPSQLVEDTYHLSQILDSYQVVAIACVPSVPRPEPDNLTTVDGILNRMLKKDDPERLQIKNSLLSMNSRSQCRTFEGFMKQYEKCTPQVHAEVQALDHFFRLNLSFVGNDRYIACSKPACLCCGLYFKHHPARMVSPDCHRKVWVNWSPQLVKNPVKGDPEYDLQVKVLNEMTSEIRRDVIADILGHSSSSPWHPDSQTAISDDRWSRVDLEELRGHTFRYSIADGSLDTEATERSTAKVWRTKELKTYVSDEDYDADCGGVSLKI